MIVQLPTDAFATNTERMTPGVPLRVSLPPEPEPAPGLLMSLGGKGVCMHRYGVFSPGWNGEILAGFSRENPNEFVSCFDIYTAFFSGGCSVQGKSE